MKAIIHLLVPAADGPIRSAGMSGTEELRYAVACSPTAPLPKSATGEARAATCVLCLASNAGQAAMEAQRPGEPEIDRRAREAMAALERGELLASPQNPPAEIVKEEIAAAGCVACENG